MEGSKIDLLTVSLLSLSLSPSLLHFWVVFWLIWPEPVCIQQVQTLQLASTWRGGCKGPPVPPTYFGKADKRDKLGEKKWLRWQPQLSNHKSAFDIWDHFGQRTVGRQFSMDFSRSCLLWAFGVRAYLKNNHALVAGLSLKIETPEHLRKTNHLRHRGNSSLYSKARGIYVGSCCVQNNLQHKSHQDPVGPTSQNIGNNSKNKQMGPKET